MQFLEWKYSKFRLRFPWSLLLMFEITKFQHRRQAMIWTNNGWFTDAYIRHRPQWVNGTISVSIYEHTHALVRHFETLQWRHNEHDGVSNKQPFHCLLNRLYGRKSKKTSKLRVTGLCVGNSPGTDEFPAKMASYAENVSIWCRHHDFDPNVELILSWSSALNPVMIPFIRIIWVWRESGHDIIY